MDRRSRTRNVHVLRRQPKMVVADDCDDGKIASGDYADIWLFGEAREEYEALLLRTDANSRTSAIQLPRYFGRFVEGKRLPEEMFKSLGRYKTGHGNEVQVHEFKAYQFRIYGVIRHYNGKRSFIGLTCDPSKKKNKADPQKIKKAAERSEEVK